MESQTQQKSSQVAIFGLGYVGCVTAACFASLGHRVTGVDKDAYKVEKVRAGEAPFFEPGLDEAVRSGVQSGKLTATTSTEEAVRNAEIALLCVGTPSERNGNLGLDQLRRVVEDIRQQLPNKAGQRFIVGVRSTVFPGTCEEIVEAALSDFPNVDVISNPEFLREGTAMRDFTEPALIVVGGSNPDAVKSVADLYAPLGLETCMVSLRTAEMIKYACNAYHAVKICFANEIGALSEKLGVDGQEVMRTFCQDTRLNVSAAYLRPGFSFGGSCLPKDLRALVYRASRLDVDVPLLESALPSNEAHLQRAIDAVLDSKGRIGVLGLTFKENTDDLRESPVITMLEYLIGKGRDIQIYDPHVSLDSIYGSNRNFLLNAIPHIGRLLVSTPEAVTGWADTLVVTQKPATAVLEAIEASGLPIIDVAGVLKRTSRNVSKEQVSV